MIEKGEILPQIPPQLIKAVEIAGPALVVAVFDLDETVFNTVLIHWKYSNRAYRMAGHNGDLPTLEEVQRAGGTQHAYNRFFPKGSRDYAEMNRVLRYSKRANKNIPFMNPEIPSIMSQIAAVDQIAPALYLTTRPDSVAEISHEDLVRRGMPD